MQKMMTAIRPLLSLLLALVIFASGGAAFAQESAATPEREQLYRDDFYIAVNEEWLKTAHIPDGENYTSTYMEMRMENRQQMLEIVKDLLGKEHVPGSNEQKLCTYYETMMDMESRNRDGVAPLMPYLEAYDNAKNLDELMQADLMYFRKTGLSNFFTINFTTDARNSEKVMLEIVGLWRPIEPLMFEDDRVYAGYEQYMKNLFALSGTPEEQAQMDAKALVAFELELARDTKSHQRVTLSELAGLYANTDVAAFFEEMGFPTSVEIYLRECNKAIEAISEENLDMLKLYAKKSALAFFEGFFSEDFSQNADKFGEVFSGTQGSRTLEEKTVFHIQEVAPELLEQFYVEKYFSIEAKEDVEVLVRQVIGIYRQRLSALDWLSDETKVSALRKLDSIKIKVGYPEVWRTTLRDTSFSTYQEGGNCFENYCAILRAIAQSKIESLTKPVDKEKWYAYAYEAQAYYGPDKNEISIPAAVLQPPIYDVQAKREQNLGGIGIIIGHEITHAFDNSGAQYDENGNYTNWWTDEDYEHFVEKCEKVIALYDGIEILPGIYADGELTLGENIADLGAMSCMLEILAQMENPDYKAFFEAHAVHERGFAHEQFIKFVTVQDPHSIFQLRVNRVEPNFQEFYDTYGVTEGDGMYIPPEDRVSIW